MSVLVVLVRCSTVTLVVAGMYLLLEVSGRVIRGADGSRYKLSVGYCDAAVQDLKDQVSVTMARRM